MWGVLDLPDIAGSVRTMGLPTHKPFKLQNLATDSSLTTTVSSRCKEPR
jgi:hypothetical protein